MSRWHRLAQRLRHSSAQPAARWLYEAVVTLELVALRLWEHTTPGPPALKGAQQAQVTAIIKSFERPRLVGRLVQSIRRYYPALPIIVVDDSREPLGPISGAEVVTMPYDSGVAAGRNEGLRHVTTPFTLVLDNDFIFYRGTRLDLPLAALLAHPAIDIVGGRLMDLPILRWRDYSRYGKPTIAAAHNIQGTFHVGGLPEAVMVPNFFVGRTERVRQVGWDPALKRVEHMDFFRRAYGRLTVVSDSRFRALHAPTPLDLYYNRARADVAGDQAYFHRVHFGSSSNDD